MLISVLFNFTKCSATISHVSVLCIGQFLTHNVYTLLIGFSEVTQQRKIEKKTEEC